MTADSEFSLLFRKYVDGTASHDERLAFLELVNHDKVQAELAQLVDAELKSRNVSYSLDEDEQQEILNNIYKAVPAVPSANRKIKLWPGFGMTLGMAARIAAVVGVLVFGLWFFNYRSDDLRDDLNDKNIYANDITPGKNGATITLASGKIIQLSGAKTGVVIGQDLKYSDGEILRDALDDKKEDDKGDVLSSRVSRDLVASTTKGQTYEFTLPDGTKVWLNAASKLQIPSNFSQGDVRKIYLDGEAYFEVTKNKKRPFVVESNGQQVEVLGTHFNINSYADEGSVKTTLLEGSVRVATRSAGAESSAVLKPNQQASLTNDVIKVKEANTEEVLAWKNGSIVFRDKTLEGLMRELARWYDVTVVYADNAPKNVTFSGAVSRTRNISTVLERMQTTGSVKFKIEERTITVMK
ncbi:FecR family protein [Pedobacter frigoris]|uniref:FecR family protein n=1 Tax=Pedobacter frigoris TaxID=2571272 RepID=UPI0029317E40|nr:FecR domain-containing protein [Pedobacter frigoris]